MSASTPTLIAPIAIRATGVSIHFGVTGSGLSSIIRVDPSFVALPPAARSPARYPVVPGGISGSYGCLRLLAIREEKVAATGLRWAEANGVGLIFEQPRPTGHAQGVGIVIGGSPGIEIVEGNPLPLVELRGTVVFAGGGPGAGDGGSVVEVLVVVVVVAVVVVVVVVVVVFVVVVVLVGVAEVGVRDVEVV
jgi:hypothetical protein